jgi:NAD(P)-dependent dehydrogenase (short-subunit alcohol dehydrogenase family)
MSISGIGKCLGGKVAIVTGAARGIGRAAAIGLAKAGANIIGIDVCAPIFSRSGVTSSTPEDLRETGRKVIAEGVRWLDIRLDQRNLPALKAAALKVEKEFGGIDIVFANAGVQEFKPLLEMEDVDWQTHIDINLTGTANVIRAFASFLIKRGGGRIIVTSSTQGKHGTKYGAAYSASKWGLIGLVKSAAAELGVYGITVNAVIPGLINTPLTRHEERYAQILEDAGKELKGMPADEETAKQLLVAKTPLGVPWIEPEDVASVVIFLASDAARMVSGSTYDVTAGDSSHFS